MRYSNLFGKSVKTVPSDISSISHRLLYQAGFIRELSAGRYELLPLGIRVTQKIEQLIDHEMERIGSQRISIPILQPISYWQKSNRDKAWGNLLMKLSDARGAEFALSATGEGVITEMVAATNPSYRDLPIIVHQFILKLRDEMRARGGLLRTREFVMKDAYSYHTSEEDFMKTYNDFYEAYENICTLFDVPYYAVVADSGPLGGDYCHEFQVPCEAGEDEIVVCDSCDYAANIEAAVFKRTVYNSEEVVLEYKEIELPYGVGTIPQLMEHYNLPAWRFIKNVMYKLSDGRLVIATIIGELDINEVKLAKALGVEEVFKAEEKDLESIGSKTGFVHSWGYDYKRENIIFIADLSIPLIRNLYGGYKTDTKDPKNVNYGRDFTSDIVADIAEVIDGCECDKCGGALRRIKSIEFGHIFKYDHFYTKHHDGFFIDTDGSKKLMWMGAYGIGIGRALAIIVEIHNDEKGIIWPETVAPYKYHLVTIGENTNLLEKSEGIYKMLLNQNKEVLWDDRVSSSAGEKLADADLIGCPVRIIVSAKNDTNSQVEIKLRSSSETRFVPYSDITSI